MPYNRVFVEGDRELTDLERKQIQDIMQHSQCPNESLINSIKDCRGLAADGTIYIGNGIDHREVIEY